ncbi:hypothetical protein ACOZ38_29530 [Sphaerisporangium viridialbum]|uniref:hypothetical protein n=1 Tax=Sphaerisporangium viridialbum TaxID=46189 RepID=UPI003C761D5F
MSSSASQPQKFEEALAVFTTRVSGNALPWWAFLGARLTVPVVFLGVGLALWEVLGDLALPVASGLFVVWWAARMRTRGQLGQVDWDTADTYWQTAHLQVPDATNAVIAAVTSATLARYRRITGIHPYLRSCPGGIQDGACRHPECLSVGVLWVGRRRVLVIGRRAAHLRPEVLESILYHEVRHSTGVMGPYAVMQVTMSMAGWIVGACLPVPLLVAVPTVWAAAGAVAWLNELIADTAAVRTTGVASCVASLKATRLQLAGVPVRRRVAHYVFIALFPTHPPMWLRVAAAHSAGLLLRPRPRPAGI